MLLLMPFLPFLVGGGDRKKQGDDVRLGVLFFFDVVEKRNDTSLLGSHKQISSFLLFVSFILLVTT